MTPQWLTIAREYLGTSEIPGPKHNAVILAWLARLGAWWRDDDTPWCGTFVAHCLQRAGLTLPKAWYRARAWADYGVPLEPHQLAPGALLVFARQGGGHVGFYAGETPTHFLVLGGNQGNQVCIARIPRERCIALRWPPDRPIFGAPLLVGDNAPLSPSEA